MIFFCKKNISIFLVMSLVRYIMPFHFEQGKNEQYFFHLYTNYEVNQKENITYQIIVNNSWEAMCQIWLIYVQ